ncbi:hypothetical protein PR048_003870 [Dryococelus australis]|uniref:Integrase catalytic domain-containing protein n=1 Tax=Dryococelus australis TaxID=614101 RepID=A0ABQ9IQE3_9NEOP|nr:hypothetical protein PR048_003870 [Dryococelus australis]
MNCQLFFQSVQPHHPPNGPTTTSSKLIAWMIQFLKNASKTENLRGDNIVVEEIEKVERRLLHLVQREEAEEIDGKWMRSLCTFVDSDGLMRQRSKIVRREEDECYRYPILLPSKHKLVELLIHDYHVKNSQAGVQILLGKLRERGFESRKITTTPAPHCGSIVFVRWRDAWILLFTCAVYQAVHFELVLILSTGAFVPGLRRFIARRGKSRVMYSDNGTNFQGSDNGFDSLDRFKREEESCSHRIQWKFIPPIAASVGRASLGYEEVSNILCEVEPVINSRHLSYMSEDTKDLVPLTPAMFLQEN